MTMSTRFYLKFSCVLSKNRHPPPLISSLYFFSPRKSALLSLLMAVKPSANHIMIKLLTFDNLFPPLQHSVLAQTHSGVKTAIAFSQQNDAGSCASNTSYRENLLLVSRFNPL